MYGVTAPEQPKSLIATKDDFGVHFGTQPKYKPKNQEKQVIVTYNVLGIFRTATR